MLKFDAQTLKVLEDAYQGRDIRQRRKIGFDALDPKPGDTILDLGCGNGLLTLDLARAVGPDGGVTGLDPSPDMLQAAATRCESQDRVTLIDGDANHLPFDADRFDKIVSLQVFEYFSDLARPLDEALRVLRPGGKLVIADMHWDSLIWHSDNPDRMNRMIAAYDQHLAHRSVPAVLPAMMRDRGMADVTLTQHTFSDIDLRPDGLANMTLHLMCQYARQNDLVPADVIDACAAEQQELAQSGRFFFSITHFACSATQPPKRG
jgi:ubiquinone/menaquinone biosynthesis C-methylase UbiE